LADNSWVSRSSHQKQIVLAVACLALGLLLLYLSRDFLTAEDSNVLAALLLGLLLLGIGIATLATAGKQTIVIDPTTRMLTVLDMHWLLDTRERTILLDEIERISVGHLGKASNFARWFYLNLHLYSGETYVLFAPGRFYAGSTDRATVESWRRRLEQTCRTDPVFRA
jgi:hypothetical protein